MRVPFFFFKRSSLLSIFSTPRSYSSLLRWPEVKNWNYITGLSLGPSPKGEVSSLF
jgi:hypothetical protein